MQLRAEAVFKKLEQLWELVQQPIVTIPGKLGEYKLGDLLGTGDVSEVYRATCDGSADYIAKVSRVPGGDKYVSLESQVLKKLQDAAANNTYSNYFPRLVESFLWDVKDQIGPDKFLRRVNVFHEPYRLWSLADILKKYPEGLEGRHICWIFRRLLTAIGFAHINGTVHGAVLPQHILIEPKSHGVCLCGWIHWAEPGTIISTVPESHKSWYPSEVLTHKYAGPETDIFLTAKTMLSAAKPDNGEGGLPWALKQFFTSLTLDSVKMRPKDAWAVEEDFTHLMDHCYGPRRFVPLVI
jgi:serine/threonine protein kinase